MGSRQVLSPTLPFVGDLPSEMQPGNKIRIRGVVNRPNGDCRIHLQTGKSLSPMDDVVLHLSLLPATREVLRNSYCAGKWGQEERIGNSPINFDEEFELTIAANKADFCVEIDGCELANFSYRCPVQTVRYIGITGGCVISAVKFENWNSVPKVISVLPCAPVYHPPTAPAVHPPVLPLSFNLPAWPHGAAPYFAPSLSLYPLQSNQPAFNPAFFQQPFLVNIPGGEQKGTDSGSALQYQLLVKVLWKICCIFFKALKFIIFVLVGGLGFYILSKRLRL
ncbi:galectin-4-like [Wyeomyia smithii]|uniref:galectin-4-like n=1 Tax=Wyeomyia smithii TaxID=174621 RepID=UPI0024681F2B|nr:galectin-4-like [Wyeomyia smithii]